jgi:hypothetical protein
MAYEGDAAEQVIRIALSSGEIALRFTGSLIKNVAAFLLAMRQNNKVVHGRKSMKKLLGNTRDLRVFPMSQEQFKKFQKLAKPRKLLYAGIGDRLQKKGTVDLMLPISEIERANQIFETMGYVPKNGRQAVQPDIDRGSVKKKEARSPSNSKDSKDRSTTPSNSSKANKTEKPSVTAKLEAFDKIAKQQGAKTKPRVKTKGR